MLDDKTYTVGDLVTAHSAGYWRITNIELRESNYPLYTIQREYTNWGTPRKSVPRTTTYIRSSALADVQRKIVSLESTIDKLRAVEKMLIMEKYEHPAIHTPALAY